MRISFLISFILLFLNIVSDIYIVRRLPESFRHGYRRVIIWSFNTVVYILFTVLIIFISLKRIELLVDYIEILMLAFCVLFVPKALFMFVSVLDYIPCLFRKKRINVFTPISVVISVLLPVMLIYGAVYGRKDIKINKVELFSEKIPVGFDGYKIVQISDLHLKTMYGNTEFLNRVADEIKALNPDLICVTGDIVSLRADEIKPYIEVLSKIKAPDGVFSILGNHDYGDYVNWRTPCDKGLNLQKLCSLQDSIGWQLLRNESRNLLSGNDTIVLIGVENWGKPPFPQYGNLSASYPSICDDKYKILLSHDPSYWDDVLRDSNIDLTLSGHVHAMQIKIDFFGKSYSPAMLYHDRWSGRYTSENCMLYINDGIGCTLFPVRIGASPEITLFVLNSTKN